MECPLDLPRPQISIIVPIYNANKYLRRCLNALCKQTLREMEIICINDGSSDESEAIVREYVAKDSRVKLISLDTNKGAAVARNRGMEEARGEFIGFVDSDDYVDSHFYSALYEQASGTAAQVVKGNLLLVSEQVPAHATAFYSINAKVRLHKAYFYHSFTTAIYRNEFIRKHKILFPENVTLFEDPVFTIMVSALCESIYTVDDAYYYYWRGDNSITERQFTEESAKDVCRGTARAVEFLNMAPIDASHYAIAFSLIISILLGTASNPQNVEENDLDDVVNVFSAGLVNALTNCKHPERSWNQYFSEIRPARPTTGIDSTSQENDDGFSAKKSLAMRLRRKFLAEKL